MQQRGVSSSRPSQYKIEQRIGSGAHSEVYAGKCTTTNREVAIKMEEISTDKHDSLTVEWSILQQLEGTLGIPKPFAFDESGNYRYLVESRTGFSLDKWLEYCGGQFSNETIGRIGDQGIRRIQQIHEGGIIHNDIKPSNIAIGYKETKNVINVLDFGVSCLLEGLNTPTRSLTGFVGTPMFASLSAHECLGRSRYDDLESLMYSLISFRKQLPWANVKRDEIQKVKSMPPESLCKGLPQAFAAMLKEVRERKKPIPDYKGMRRKLLGAMGYAHSYDWTLKLYRDVQERRDDARKRRVRGRD